jgi:hypothetical protein
MISRYTSNMPTHRLKEVRNGRKFTGISYDGARKLPVFGLVGQFPQYHKRHVFY